MVLQIIVAHGVPGNPAGTTFVYPTAFVPPFLIFVWIGLFLRCGMTKLPLAMTTST